MTVFIDSNIPTYLVGADHPNKAAARSALELAIAAGETLVTDAEVLREILHRYVAINRREAIDPATDALRAVVDEIYPVDAEAVLAARRLLDRVDGLSARDAVHLAIMRQHGVDDILSFDTGFDMNPGLRRSPS